MISSRAMMRHGLVNKRSNSILNGPASPAPTALTACVSPLSDQQENVVLGPDVMKLRHVGSKVWSDIRGAVKAIGRGSQNGKNWAPASFSPPILTHTGSESSTVAFEHVEYVTDETLSVKSKVSSKGKANVYGVDLSSH